jgi:hypothetical protein
MAEDAAQEECLGHFRHPIAFGHRRLGHRAGHHRELPDAAVPAERAGDRAADYRDLPPLRPERPPDRDPRPGNAEARLLLPVAARQSPVRARSRQGRAGLHRRVIQVRPGRDRKGPRRTWPRRFRCRLARAPRRRVGCRHHPKSSWPEDHCHEASVISWRQAPLQSLHRSLDVPSSAQVVVFDPNNYAQNVLTAARALQQINNQITSLQNQAQMLINQAKNLANLPFSSLATASAVDPAHPAASEPGPADRLRRPADRTTRSRRPTPRPRRLVQPDADIKRASALADLGRGASGRARCRPVSSAISTPTAPRCRRW